MKNVDCEVTVSKEENTAHSTERSAIADFIVMSEFNVY